MGEKLLTVGKLREQTALCGSDTKVIILVNGKPSTSLVLRSAYPDTTDAKGKWNSTFKIEAESDKEAELPNQRLFDLVRYMRGELFDKGLITMEEFNVLVVEHSAVKRLEDYDAAVDTIRRNSQPKMEPGIDGPSLT